ncbi:hypothetical protein BDV96DRAFT_644899 [Lophiotrema nucula]|uniref:Uncharacterized protein n=1 Tax=Lophiotrema nucula TaxID=690887 RepID=A0A6A5ZEI2_9PLEO|nr:hypothetical protein BDV96DRAFT_644899 [Lophiotrema nucula]
MSLVRPPPKMPVAPWDEGSKLHAEATPSKKRASAVGTETEEPKSKKARFVERVKSVGRKVKSFLQQAEQSKKAKKLVSLYASCPAFLFEEEEAPPPSSPPPPPPPPRPTFNVREEACRRIKEYCKTIERERSPDYDERMEDCIFPEAPVFRDPASDNPEYYMSGALPIPDDTANGKGSGFENKDDNSKIKKTKHGDLYREEDAHLALLHEQRPYHYWTIGKDGFQQWTLL